MKNTIRYACSLIFLCVGFFIQAQEAIIEGKVTDGETSLGVDFVTIYVDGRSFVTESKTDGSYQLSVPANEAHTIVFTRIGYKEYKQSIKPIRSGGGYRIDVAMVGELSDVEIVVTENAIDEASMIREEVTEFKMIPSTTGNFESILPHIALGTSGGTGGELSSQYNVRGGNYDENLVYINDFEIFRPQLIRNSQQEGLSFANINLISNLSFSSGGFEAKYGDKMSSILDIKYKRPNEFKASAEASFLGASAHMEGSKSLGSSSYKKLRYLVGARYKTTKYLLGTLDVSGQYVPNFIDIQGYLTYDISRDLQMGIIGNYNQSKFSFVPRSRSTALGLTNIALRLSSAFEGNEVNDFTNGMSGVSFTYIPDKNEHPLYLKLLASNYLSDESETFDIQGRYRLSQIETDLDSGIEGQEVALLGSGVEHSFARNQLFNRITNIEHKGGIEFQKSTGDSRKVVTNFLQWGLKFQNENFDDELNEWERLDSAGYSLPFSEENVLLSEVLKTENNITSNRISGFFQNALTYRKEGQREFKLSYGIRTSYWDLNEEFIFSPRAQLLYKPLQGTKDVSFKLAGGVYYQPPFYRELRRPDGTINTNLKSQRSIHAVAGITYDFLMKKVSNKKFRLISEIYYKKLDNLITYEIDNIKLRYSGENDAVGHVVGLDFRINGEFVPGAESWVNVSFLQARESINGVDHVKFINPSDSAATVVNSVPRPSDQFFNMNVFFQDYLPGRENFKMHMNIVYGSGLPFGVRDNNIEFRNVFRYRPYQRVDLGFSWQLWNKSKGKGIGLFKGFDNVWMSLELFNLLGIENVASNTWIKTIFAQQYAIPNNLTSRRINLKFRVEI